MKRRTFIIASLALALGFAVRVALLSQVVPAEVDPFVPAELTADFDPIVAQIGRIQPLHEKKHPNQPGDWLDRFPELGQSFAQYVQIRSAKPLHIEFKGIDIQPLGEFDETQQQIIAQTAEFTELFFGVSVRLLDPIPLDEIPSEARRMRDDVEQLLSTWIMNECLYPRRRRDAMATMGFVTSDLWPGNLNWVFGQASLDNRVGICSLHRNGDPRASDANYRLCLLRTLKTAVHETGHMLGIPHCSEYECGMNGCRSTEESDRRPLEFCPQCQAKIWWTCGAASVRRTQRLAEFCDRVGLKEVAIPFRRESETLSAKDR